MAENEELDQDLDLDAKPAVGKKRIILLVATALVVIAVAVGVTLVLLGGDEEPAGEEVASQTTATETHYLPLKKMVVNFAQKGPVKYLQVEMELMAHDPVVLDVVTEHMPAVRNDMLVLLASQNFETLSSREGKEQLRGELLAVARRIVKQNAGLDGPQAVYFTNFVMQ